MAEQLASVPEEPATGFPTPYPPSTSYRESIRSVDGPEWRIRSSLFTQSGQSASSYSGGSSSNISGCSSGLVSAGAPGFGAGELAKIAHKMVNDGYIQQMVQAYSGQNPYSVLEAWFFDLDVAWVLQSGESHGSQFQLQPQELVDKWIRSLTIIVLSIKELVSRGHVTPAVGRFGKASISAMLDFVHIFNLSIAEKLQAMLLMYICVSTASYDMSALQLFSSSAVQSIFSEIGNLLEREENKLTEAISGMITEAKVKAFSNVDYSWDIEILQGRGEVHRSVRFFMDCIVSMRKAQASSQNSAQRHNTGKLYDLTDGAMCYLKNMLQEKSRLCLDPSLRYIFLLNNFNFVAQVSEPSTSLDVELLSLRHRGLELTPDCEKHMDSYLEVSWGHVLSCISTSKISGPLHRRNSIPSLDKLQSLFHKVYHPQKFQSVFHKTYQTQKFWKVPDPRLRSLLREAITKRVISAYRGYLKEYPELGKHVSGGSSDPDILEEMVGELFEG